MLLRTGCLIICNFILEKCCFFTNTHKDVTWFNFSVKVEIQVILDNVSEVYLEPGQTSMIELFLQKGFIIDVWNGFKYASSLLFFILVVHKGKLILFRLNQVTILRWHFKTRFAFVKKWKILYIQKKSLFSFQYGCYWQIVLWCRKQGEERYFGNQKTEIERSSAQGK